MNEALELCKLCDERTLGLILALLRRTQASSAASVITNLQASSEHDSALARNVLWGSAMVTLPEINRRVVICFDLLGRQGRN